MPRKICALTTINTKDNAQKDPCFDNYKLLLFFLISVQRWLHFGHQKLCQICTGIVQNMYSMVVFFFNLLNKIKSREVELI